MTASDPGEISRSPDRKNQQIQNRITAIRAYNLRSVPAVNVGDSDSSLRDSTIWYNSCRINGDLLLLSRETHCSMEGTIANAA